MLYVQQRYGSNMTSMPTLLTPPSVLLCEENGHQTRLHPGDIIGRGHFSALLLDNPEIPEANALLSQRGDTLKLIKLRGSLTLDSEPDFKLGELDLEAGQRVRLSDSVVLEVVEVNSPSHILVLNGLSDNPLPLKKPE